MAQENAAGRAVKYVANPPWVNRILAWNWGALEMSVGADAMPVQEERSTPRKRKVTEYGCGVYGCVAPTGTPGVVFKLTSDPLEAHFVAAAMQVGHWPEGIVRYAGITQVAGMHQRRPVFALWREEAYDVGGLAHADRSRGLGPEWFRKLDAYEKMAFERFRSRLDRFKDWAHRFKIATDHVEDRAPLLAAVRKADRWAWETIEEPGANNGYERVVNPRWTLPEKLAVCLRACQIQAEAMGNEPKGDQVGQALDFYLGKGLLLADVHVHNLGQVNREEYGGPIWAITDPGHAVPLDERFAAVRVPSLAAA